MHLVTELLLHLIAFVLSITVLVAPLIANEKKTAAPAGGATTLAVLDDAAWADLRSESAELQVLDERFQKLVAQAELTRQAFAAKRASWEQKVEAARTKVGIISECLPDPAQRRWVRVDGTQTSCVKKVKEK